MWLSTGPSATGSGGVPAPIEPRMKKLASILLGTLFAACALHAGEAVASELSPSVVEKALADPVGNWGNWGQCWEIGVSVHFLSKDYNIIVSRE